MKSHQQLPINWNRISWKSRENSLGYSISWPRRGRESRLVSCTLCDPSNLIRPQTSLYEQLLLPVDAVAVAAAAAIDTVGRKLHARTITTDPPPPAACLTFPPLHSTLIDDDGINQYPTISKKKIIANHQTKVVSDKFLKKKIEFGILLVDSKLNCID